MTTVDLKVPEARPARPVWPSLRRGLRGRCPACGKGALFGRFLKTVPSCTVCGKDLTGHRADDAPPYFTIVIVGHVIVPAMLAVQMATDLSNMAHLAIWLPLTGGLALALLQPVKGAVVALQWALRMHGFDEDGEADPLPGASAVQSPASSGFSKA